MTSVDIDVLINALDPTGRGGRHHVDRLATLIRELVDHVEPATVPRLVLDTIRQGEREGRWSVASRTTVLRGSVELPKSVLLHRRMPPADRRRRLDVPLRPELARWAATLSLTTSQRELLLAVNDWLCRTDGGKVPMAAAAERAYELLRDEKAFDSSPPRGGTTLWRGDRLTFELLRCERVATPLTWEPTTAEVGEAGSVVCVENHATFRSLLRVLRQLDTPPWVAVAWVQGRNTAPLESLPGLPFRVTRLDYLGDLDAAGLDIAATACATAQRVNVPAGPAIRLWELLVVRSPRPDRKVPQILASQLAAWLPEHLRTAATAVLASGHAIPQEALRYDHLATALGQPEDVRP